MVLRKKIEVRLNDGEFEAFQIVGNIINEICEEKESCKNCPLHGACPPDFRVFRDKKQIEQALENIVKE